MSKKITLNGKPETTNKVYRRHGNIIYLSKEGRELKVSYAEQARQQWTGGVLSGNIWVHIDLFFSDERRRDIDNWHKILLDSLTGIVWEDDSQIFSMTVKKLSAEIPRIEITIGGIIMDES